MRVALLILIVIVAAQCQMSFVELLDSVTVTSPIIHLRDIAKVSGSLKGKLDTIVVGRAAHPGNSRYILRDNLLLYKGLSEKLIASVKLTGATRAVVKSVGESVSYSNIKKDIIAQLSDKIEWRDGDWSLEFIRSDSAIAKVWAGNYSVKVGKLRSSHPRGKITIPVSIIQGEVKERYVLPFKINVTTEVLVATKSLSTKQRVSKGSYRVERRDITSLLFRPLVTIDMASNYYIKSGVVQEGSVIPFKRVVKESTVEKGSAVTIVSKSGTATVQVRGVARRSGDIGDLIAVENGISKKIIKATIIKAGVVEVIKGGRV